MDSQTIGIIREIIRLMRIGHEHPPAEISDEQAMGACYPEDILERGLEYELSQTENIRAIG